MNEQIDRSIMSLFNDYTAPDFAPYFTSALNYYLNFQRILYSLFI